MMELPVSEGLLVVQTQPGGPADVAGIKGGTRRVMVGNYEFFLGGDVIVAVDGKPMRDQNALVNYLMSEKAVGDKLKVTLLRGGKGQPVDVEVALTAVRE
jgi:S1-C subfamily serine protease